MEMRRECYAIILVVIIFVLAMESAQGMRKTAEMCFGNVVSEVNEAMAEQKWIKCWKELVYRRDSFEHFDFCVRRKVTSDLTSILLTRRELHKIISILPPQMKQELLDCLRKKNLLIGVSGQKVISAQWVIKCFELIFCWPNGPRRYLASEVHQQVSSSSKSIAQPSLAVPSGYGPLPFEPAPAKSLPPNGKPRQLIQKKVDDQQVIIDISPTVQPTQIHKRSSQENSENIEEMRSDIMKETVIAIVITATATFCFVGMLFCCWLRFKGSNEIIEPTERQRRDERPLLRLSDFSSGSQNSINLGNGPSLGNAPSTSQFSAASRMARSIKLKFSFSRKPTNHGPSLPEVSSPEAIEEETLPSLKPPPGRRLPLPPGVVLPRAGPPPPPPPLPTPYRPSSSSYSPTPTPPPAPPPVPTCPSRGGPCPLPPPKGPRAPPAPPIRSKLNLSPLGPHHKGNSDSNVDDDFDKETGVPKAKLKPFFWDKVMACPGQSMVWHEISSGSFQFNEEMIEALFSCNAAENHKTNHKKDLFESSIKYIQIVDNRKAQNLSILLRALNVTTEEVVAALQEGHELPVELLQTMQKMAPTADEELKLRLFAGDVNDLGPAERFLKAVVEIQFSFKRIDALLFMSSSQEEVSSLKESFATLEIASNKLRSSRLFLKLLEAVLKTGNRMNDGTYRGGAIAFKLDTLLKLSDVKGTDGKTTLLHFVVSEIIRSEGIRAVRTAKASNSLSSVQTDEPHSTPVSSEHYCNLGLQVVSGLSNELDEVRKAAVLDGDVLASTVSKLRQSLQQTKAFLDSDMKNLEGGADFYGALCSFIECIETDIMWLAEEEKRIMALVKSTADYFHGNAGKDEGLRLFTIVRDFLIMLDKACKDVRNDRAKQQPTISKSNIQSAPASPENSQKGDTHCQRLFPAIKERRVEYSCSDDSSSDDDSTSE